jgi:hypothetical protein
MIAALLTQYRQHCRELDQVAAEKRAAGEPREPLRIMNFSEITRERSPEERVEDLLRDPIRSALKGRVREIGWKLWIKGGTDLMTTVSDRVQDLCPEFPSFAGSTLDKWWDEIGVHDDACGMWMA